MSTDTATHSARDGSVTLHQAAAPAASTSTAHRKGAAQRSASRAAAGRWVSALRIIETMVSSRVSPPTCSTRTSTAAPTLMLPATTVSPSALPSGADSPLSIDSSARVWPCSTRPSAGKA